MRSSQPYTRTLDALACHGIFTADARLCVDCSTLLNRKARKKIGPSCRGLSAKKNADLAFGFGEIALFFHLFQIGFGLGL